MAGSFTDVRNTRRVPPRTRRAASAPTPSRTPAATDPRRTAEPAARSSGRKDAATPTPRKRATGGAAEASASPAAAGRTRAGRAGGTAAGTSAAATSAGGPAAGTKTGGTRTARRAAVAKTAGDTTAQDTTVGTGTPARATRSAAAGKAATSSATASKGAASRATASRATASTATASRATASRATASKARRTAGNTPAPDGTAAEGTAAKGSAAKSPAAKSTAAEGGAGGTAATRRAAAGSPAATRTAKTPAAQSPPARAAKNPTASEPARKASTRTTSTRTTTSSTPADQPRRARPARPAAAPTAAGVDPATDILVGDGHVADHTGPDGSDGAGGLVPPRPAPRRPGLIPTDIADALSSVIARATGEIRKYEKGSRKGGDIEDVHKMRVATRRIRAYLKAARPVMDHAAADGLRADLRDVAAALGVVRDLDVMIDRLHQEADGLGSPDTEALGVLIDHLDGERTQARSALVEALDAPGYPALLTELDVAAAAPPVADPWADLHELAGKEWRKLDKAHRVLHRAHGDDPPDDDLHELRIWGKRARYTAELLRDKGPATDFLAALAALQEVLGDHQDAHVLEERLRRLVVEAGDPQAGVAAGRIVQLCVQARKAARAAYPAAWDAVEAAAERAFPA